MVGSHSQCPLPRYRNNGGIQADCDHAGRAFGQNPSDARSGGPSTEIVSAALISGAGFTGLPVSTTHIVTSGIGGTMVTSGAGIEFSMVRCIVVAWLVTLPVTIVVAAAHYYL